MLDEDRLREDEYEKQYYGFSSTELCEDFKDQTRKAVKMTLTEIETALEAAEYDKGLREQKLSEFYAAYMESADSPLQKFKSEARKIFAIPKNVVLDEDQHKGETFSDEDIIKLKQEVAELEKELLREQVFLAKCKQQKELIDTKIKPLYDKTNSIIKSLKNLPKDKEAVDENHKIMVDLFEEHVQYYFNSENSDTENLYHPEIKSDFIKATDDFLK